MARYLSLAVVAVLVLAFSHVRADQSTSTQPVAKALQNGCAVVNKDAPAIYLSLGLEQDSDPTIVRLTLHNNTSCTIILDSDENSDPAKLNIKYDIQEPQRKSAPSHRGYWTDSDMGILTELKPNKSIGIRVLKVHADQRLTISVRFLFSWDLGVSGDYEHRVYFDSKRWPKE
jgi:hypothetical protein